MINDFVLIERDFTKSGEITDIEFNRLLNSFNVSSSPKFLIRNNAPGGFELNTIHFMSFFVAHNLLKITGNSHIIELNFTPEFFSRKFIDTLSGLSCVADMRVNVDAKYLSLYNEDDCNLFDIEYFFKNLVKCDAKNCMFVIDIHNNDLLNTVSSQINTSEVLDLPVIFVNRTGTTDLPKDFNPNGNTVLSYDDFKDKYLPNKSITLSADDNVHGETRDKYLLTKKVSNPVLQQLLEEKVKIS